MTNQQELINDTSHIRRPKRSSVDMEHIYSELANNICEYSNDDPDEMYEVLKQIAPADWETGFEIAKKLGDYGYEPNSDMVEHCESLSFLITTEHRVLVREWVKKFDVQPVLQVGDMIHMPGLQGDITIRSIDEKHAQYGLYIPSEGHIIGGGGESGTLATIKNYEDVHANYALIKKADDNPLTPQFIDE